LEWIERREEGGSEGEGMERVDCNEGSIT
jgi:hypothetical protein